MFDVFFMFVVKGVMVSHKSFRANGSEHDKMLDKFPKLTLVGNVHSNFIHESDIDTNNVTGNVALENKKIR